MSITRQTTITSQVILLGFALLLFSGLATALEPGRLQKRIKPAEVAVDVCSNQQLELLKGKVAALDETSTTLRGLASQPVPRELAYAESKEAYRYGLWLGTASDRIDALSRKGRRIIKQCEDRRRGGGMPSAEAGMGEMQRSFNEQYLQLQNKISHESRQFSLVSNIMKNRHDTAKNSINNIR
ncbi:hypothetical protein ACFL0R_02380 [Pseudomonadota bacterium]